MKILNILEANYPGNIGVMEMAKFFSVATPEQKAKMKSLLNLGKNQEAWAFLQQVTGMKLS